jgi:hypothetical protein
MNPNLNPFSPGAGIIPSELAGRSVIIDKAKISFSRMRLKRPERSVIFTGLRGVGKTVLLRRIEEIAESEKCTTIFLECSEKRSLLSSLVPALREILLTLDRMEASSQAAKRGLRILRSFTNAIKLKYGDVELSLDVDPETGMADSGNLEHDLPSLFEAIAKAAADKKTAIILLIDELQIASEDELSALIMAMHRISQKNLPMILIGAGLPYLIGKAGKAKSYAERLFDFSNIGKLEKKDAINALQLPVKEQGAKFSKDAIEEIIKKTEGYPYFIQEWGHQAWNASPTSIIDLKSVRIANKLAIARLDESFFKVRFDRLTEAEKKYLRILAELSGENRKTNEVALRMGRKVTSLSPLRSGLITKGMIYSQAHGEADFTVPLFDQFMKRTMPYSENS